jgi:hypothetical protein
MDAFSKIMCVSAQLWSRFVTKYTNWPWRLATLVDIRTPAVEKIRIRDEFSKCPSCELDQGFSAPLRESLVNPSLVDVEAYPLLAQFAGRTRLTNMKTERLLSQMRTATPGSTGRKPTLERYCHQGHLTQHMSRFASKYEALLV